MAERKTDAKVVPLFGDDPTIQVADEVAVGRKIIARPEPVVANSAAVDLTGKPKVLLAIGAGNTGKTTALRWIAERAVEGKRQTFFAAIDPEHRALGSYFEGVHEPPSFEPSAVMTWLEKFLGFVMAQKATAAIDLGGGDTSLSRLIASAPDLVQVMEEAGVSPVAIYLLSSRVYDLSALASLEQAGFQPRATALVMNEGRADPTMSREAVFARTMQHSAFRAAIERGAVALWMPRLIPAKEVEDRRITFAQARDAIAPSGRRVTPLGPFDRSRVREWLGRMDAEFAPVSSWLP
jgi:hypothetical protein